MLCAATKNIVVSGIPVTGFTSYEKAIQAAVQRIDDGKRTFCVAINLQKVEFAKQDAELRDILTKTADWAISDSAGIVLAARVLCGTRIARITGIDLALELVRKAEEKDWRIFLLGATAESNAMASERLRQLHPKLTVAGCQHGYFEDDNEIVKQINESSATVLFVAMGSPRQEKWMAQNWDQLNVLFCLGVGGTLDVLSGKTKRAPEFFQKTGTEGIFRLLTHSEWCLSTRLSKGMAVFKFVLSVLVQKCSWGPSGDREQSE